MNKRFAQIAAVCVSLLMVDVSVYGQEVTDSVRVFLYNASPNGGLRLSVTNAEGGLQDKYQLFTSDYSQWGSQKRMYKPFVLRLDDGGYAAVFQVNDDSPCFGVTRSDDMVQWRPQDYPRMSTRGCLAPVIRKLSLDRYEILYKTKEGMYRHTVTDHDFRHFSADEPATEADYRQAAGSSVWAVVGKDRVEGQYLTLSAACYQALARHHEAAAQDYVRAQEKLADDGTRFSSLASTPLQATLHVGEQPSRQISDKLIGIFFEDISYAADGGLYAEMVQNRDFEYSSADRREWKATTAWKSMSGTEIRVETRNPLSSANPHHVVLTDEAIANEGWDGICVDGGAKYDFSIYVRLPKDGRKTFQVSLQQDGRMLAEACVKARGEGWQRYTATLRPKESADKAMLVVTPLDAQEAAVDMISLFPRDTFKGRKNGLRKDLAQTLADLHPKFVRFPGGCMSHGDGLANIYHWNHTVGELYDRIPDRNIWGYHQTRGLGFFEFFQFCEDIGADPLPVLAAGVPCQNSAPDSRGYGGQQGGIPMDSMPAYIDEILHLIEWANGNPADSPWARLRAEAGHPKPFGLKYIGIGNEDLISTPFEERTEMICKAIREAYPDIQICGTVGPFHAPSSDYVEGWKFAREHSHLLDLVDEHYYESIGWFINNQHYYDHYDRQAPKVYLGEYAARDGQGSLDCALAEALYLCGVERNGDVVSMTSYAPLMSKNGHSNWSPDMIYFDNRQIVKTASYETQRLFSTYGGDELLSSRLEVASTHPDVERRVSATVVRDTTTGHTYLKMVNVLPVEMYLEIVLPDGMKLSRRAAEVLSGTPGQETVKATSLWPWVETGGRPTLVLPPYSFAAVRL